MSYHQGSRLDDLADVVLQNIHERETLIERLEKVHTKDAHGRGIRVQKLLYGIHNASLGVVEAIAAWNLDKQDAWLRKKNIETHSSPTNKLSTLSTGLDSSAAPCPFNVFLWNGQNYLQKMLSDLDFVGNITEAVVFLGNVSFHRNPFLLPLDIDNLAWGNCGVMESNVWKDIHAERIRRAAFAILLDEYNRMRRPSSLLLGSGGSGNSEMDSWRFYPPQQLSFDDISSYTSMSDPPSQVAITICCAHLVLGGIDAGITDKLVQLTKPIILSIARQPTNGLLHNVRLFNPLRQTELNQSTVKLVYPFIMNPKMDQIEGASINIVHLCKFLRSIVMRLADEEIVVSSSKTMNNANRIFEELEADYQRGASKADSHTLKSQREAEKVDFSRTSNKENERARQNDAIQTENTSLNEVVSDPKQSVDRGVLDGGPETSKLIPYPLAITVNVTEGSRVVVINGRLDEKSMLKADDIIRICDAHESSDWIVSEAPSNGNVDSPIAFELSAAYDHSRISAKENKANTDAVNRLCYPHRRMNGNDGTEKLYKTEDCTRHVASDDSGSLFSPLHINEARIWKLVPEEEDTRPAWRREFDDGVIPYRDNDGGYDTSATHFRVSLSMEKIEHYCIDSPYPLVQCVHQQRVLFFESIPLMDVINQAFVAVCKWHPQGNLIDNVKWAKLSRKMKFLSNVKNPKHETDMAFVRHNEDRKLDLIRFQAILEDIALIQFPALPAKDAVRSIVWASLVMLPDVNAKMWKEAKRMAMNVEVRRVCAQTRLAALVRKNLQQAKYSKEKVAAVVIAKYVRRFLARNFVSKIVHALRQDEEYKRRTNCATVLQTAWRRFFWRNRFLLHQERRIADQRELISATRSKFREERDRKYKSIVLRDVIRLDSTIAVVNISLHDENVLLGEYAIQLSVYVPSTKETFNFSIDECSLRECIEKAKSSEGRLSWNEMLKEDVLRELLNRLMLRVVRGRPIFVFCKRNIAEKGLLIDKRVVRAAGELFILSTFRSPHEFVFCTYQSSNRVQLRTKLSVAKLREWIHETNHNPDTLKMQNEQSHVDDVSFLDPRKQTELIEWLAKRVVLRRDPHGEVMQLRLQFEAEAERVLGLVTKVQGQWRRLKSLRAAKEKATEQYEKIFVRESNAFAYRNIRTDERQWEKPKLLGNNELCDPVDEWRREESVDPSTGQRQVYYANYATGQSSWLSVVEAARMIQRRYRSKHESDLIGKKASLPDVVKAMRFIHGAREKYMSEPNKLAHIVNFALLTHCVELDFIQARPIYEKALELSPNHPLIIRAYGIFILASRQIPEVTTFQTACRLFHEANVVDPAQAKFQSAAEIYFRWAVLVDPRNPLALLNYALLHQCIYRAYDKAEQIYRAALALDPTNTFVLENYHLFTGERYPGGAYASLGPPFSSVRRANIVEERPEWSEWSKLVDPECPKDGFEIFFYNRFTKETRFDQPSQDSIWQARLKRSKLVAGKTSNWVEYFDLRTQTSFFYDSLNKQYACQRG